MRALLRELQSGAARMSGTSLAGTIAIDEAGLNQALSPPGTPQAMRIELRAGNRLTFFYRHLHASVELPRPLDLSRSMEVTFRVASLLVAWGLKRLLRRPYIRVHGHDVTVDLAGIGALAPYHPILRSVRHVALTTDAGRLRAQFAVDIDDAGVRRPGGTT
jgi:hypothetical protein